MEWLGWTYLLGSVLSLLPELPGGLLDLLGHSLLVESACGLDTKDACEKSKLFPLAGYGTHPDKPVLGLKLPLRLFVVVDQSETLGRSTSKLGLQAKDDNPLLLGLVKSGELVAEFISGQVGPGGVKDGNDELLSVEQSVGDEFGGSDGNGSGGVL
jgi:hypothetical protein